ncbi:MAG: hypothetical protein RDU25_02360 [Patescibacteria group bacterium]|nr:hypothetical protein [Patescibacteria group bacterium]
MKVWLSYHISTIELISPTLREVLSIIRSTFSSNGITVVDMLEDVQQWDAERPLSEETVMKAYEIMPTCDGCISVCTSRTASEERGWETGFFAGQGKPTTIAVEMGHSLPFRELLFSLNPANKHHSWPGVIRFERLEGIAPAFVAGLQKAFAACIEEARSR